MNLKYLVAFGRDGGRWKRKDEDLCAERLHHLSHEHQNTSDKKKKKKQHEICEALFSVSLDMYLFSRIQFVTPIP